MTKRFKRLCTATGLIAAALTATLLGTPRTASAETLFCVFLIGGCGCDVLGVGCTGTCVDVITPGTAC